MKPKKFFALCLTALMIASGGGTAFAQGGEGGGGQADPSQDPLALYKMAGINSDQEQQILKLAREFEDGQRVRAKSLLALVGQIRVLSLQPDPPEEQLLSTQADMNKLTGEMAIERQKLLLKVRKVLTPEQRKKLVAIMSQPPSAKGAAPADAPPADEQAGEGDGAK